MYKQREIVLLPFPYSDLTAVKRRPVLVLSNNSYNNKFKDIVVAAITSNVFLDEFSIDLNNEDLEYGLLPEKSIVKIGKLFTANQESVIKKFSVIRQ